jgi:ribosome-binding factor A
MTRRVDRVREAVQTLIAQLLVTQVNDPRIGLVTITAVRLSSDLRYARCYFSSPGDDASRRRTLRGLRSAVGFFRAQMARSLRLRAVPELEFEFDPSIEHSIRVSQLLQHDRQAGRRP